MMSLFSVCSHWHHINYYLCWCVKFLAQWLVLITEFGIIAHYDHVQLNSESLFSS